MGDPRVAKRLFVDFGREPFLAQVQGHRDLCPQGCESFQAEIVSLCSAIPHIEAVCTSPGHRYSASQRWDFCGIEETETLPGSPKHPAKSPPQKQHQFRHPLQK